VKLEFDSGKNKANIAKHGVDMAAAAGFDFDTAETWLDTRQNYGEDRTVAPGFIAARLHVLVFTVRGRTVRAISLRKANHKERKAYHGEK
jgi:uncharacterized DUF497 family protein